MKIVADMTKRERVMAALKGEPVDHVPMSFFGHHHWAEQSPEMLATYLQKQNQKYDWDFMKVNFRSSCYGEAWGCKYRFDSQRGPLIENPVVKSADDFGKLEKLEPTEGPLGDQIKVTKILGENLKGSVPFIHTIFSPLTVASYLTGAIPRTNSEVVHVQRYMRENPEMLHHGLSVISQTLANYAREAIRAGADGIFITTTTWSRDACTEEEYRVFGKPYDLAVYKAANEEGAIFNVLHICRENIMFNLLSDYPVQLINYGVRCPRNPSLREAMTKTDKALWGGLSCDTLLYGPEDAIILEAQDAVKQTGGRRLFLGPDCSISSEVPEGHLFAVSKACKDW